MTNKDIELDDETHRYAKDIIFEQHSRTGKFMSVSDVIRYSVKRVHGLMFNILTKD